MAKIVSRLSAEEENLQDLREILEAATLGGIAAGGAIEPGTTLTELVTQVDIACASLLETIKNMAYQRDNALADLVYLEKYIEVQKAKIKPFNDAASDGIPYDDELDHATRDAMECLVASGAFEPTFDGELTMDEKVVLSKEDFKPVIRQAIDTWLQLKLSQ